MDRTNVAVHLAWWTLACGLYFVIDTAAQPDPHRAELLTRAVVWSACGAAVSMVLWQLYAQGSLRGGIAAVAVAFVGGLVGGVAHFAAHLQKNAVRAHQWRLFDYVHSILED